MQTAGALTGNTNGVMPVSGSNLASAGVFSVLIQLSQLTFQAFRNIIAAPLSLADLISFYFGGGLNQLNGQLPGQTLG